MAFAALAFTASMTAFIAGLRKGRALKQYGQRRFLSSKDRAHAGQTRSLVMVKQSSRLAPPSISTHPPQRRERGRASGERETMPITLPKELENLNDVDEHIKPLYVAKEGGAGFVFKDVAGMQSAFISTKEKLQQATAQLNERDQQLAGWKDYKLDEVKDLVGKKAEIDRLAANQPQEIAQMKLQLEQTYGGKITAAEQKANLYKGHIEKKTRTEALSTALTQAGVRADRLEQAAQLVAPQISVIWDANGKPKAVVLGENNMPKFNPETTEEMKPADIVAQFKKTTPEWFSATAGNGGGSNGGNTPVPTDGAKVLTWSLAQQEAYAKQHGEASLQALIRNATGGRAA